MSASPQPFNPEQFKLQQRKIWDKAAPGWQSWWSLIEQGAQVVSDRLVELAQIKPGDKVLDIATGIGEPAATAAKRVGPSGRVIATDLSSQMLTIARSRSKSLGLDQIVEFREGDAEKLDLPKSSFNAALCRWGLMFLPNLPASLTSIRQLLVPGGRLAAAVWSTIDKVPMANIAFSVVRKEINAPPPPPGSPNPFSLGDTELLKRRFTEAGFSEVKIEILNVKLVFQSAQEYIKMQQEVNAPLQAMVSSQPEEKRRQVWDAVTNAVNQYADSRGAINTDNETMCVAGRS